MDTQDNAMPCRDSVQAGKGEGYKGKHDFQAQGLLNLYKNTYGSPHWKPSMPTGIPNLLLVKPTSKGGVTACLNCKDYVSKINR